MADDSENPGFLRKVARFVSNPTTDWADLTRPPESAESELDKAEIKAMIERKRRNDFVRKREFDMLRKIRREGLANGMDASIPLSNLDSEPRSSDIARPDQQVKAKIDAIEQQMVGESLRRHTGPADFSSSFYNAPTQPSPLATQPAPVQAPPVSRPVHLFAEAKPAATPRPAAPRPAAPPPPPPVAKAAPPAPIKKAIPPPTMPKPAASAAPKNTGIMGLSDNADMDVSEVVHDPDLDEAVIAFANADFDQCERSLTSLVATGGKRAQHSETWLVLFDLYRATDKFQKFDALAPEFAQTFGMSAPQWFSLPQQVAAVAASKAKDTSKKAVKDKAKGLASPAPGSAGPSEAVGWVAPTTLDTEAVARLRSQLLQLPYPWILDFTPMVKLEPQACGELALMLRGWAKEPHDMKWLGAKQFLDVLQEATPAGDRDVDPALWTLRMEALRMLGRSDQFDEVAIDYCVTYEVSPPSWEPAACRVNARDDGGQTIAPHMSKITDISTSFVESRLDDTPSLMQVASLELSGQLVGDITPVLNQLDDGLGTAVALNIACSRLIRVDFIAAGDLLNWVLARRSENRTIHFEEANRLVALFFGAMGINEHARVRIRNV